MILKKLIDRNKLKWPGLGAVQQKQKTTGTRQSPITINPPGIVPESQPHSLYMVVYINVYRKTFRRFAGSRLLRSIPLPYICLATIESVRPTLDFQTGTVPWLSVIKTGTAKSKPGQPNLSHHFQLLTHTE